jgi:ArsR family transcriptional regulator
LQDRHLYYHEQALVEHLIWYAARITGWFEIVSSFFGGKMKNQAQQYREISQIFKALAHPSRLKLMENLMKRECCVGEIQKCLALSQPNVSQHLSVLKEAGLIVGRRERNKICYRISDDRIMKILKAFEIGEK